MDDEPFDALDGAVIALAHLYAEAAAMTPPAPEPIPTTKEEQPC